MNKYPIAGSPIFVAVVFSIAFSVLFALINNVVFHQPQIEVFMTSIGSGIAVGIIKYLHNQNTLQLKSNK